MGDAVENKKLDKSNSYVKLLLFGLFTFVISVCFDVFLVNTVSGDCIISIYLHLISYFIFLHQ